MNKYLEFHLTEVERYCTSDPEPLAEADWPTSHALKVNENLVATCKIGYTSSNDGLPTAKCLAGFYSKPGSGEWGPISGECVGKLFLILFSNDFISCSVFFLK